MEGRSLLKKRMTGSVKTLASKNSSIATQGTEGAVTPNPIGKIARNQATLGMGVYGEKAFGKQQKPL